MALLDGQYNILSEQDLGQGRNLFEASKRSGERVRILWYELMTLDDELAFENYRQLLRQLKQNDMAAIHDIVSRPGANYVVWEHPVNERAKRNRYTKEFGGLLEEAGYRLEDAHIHFDELNQAKLYMLELSSGSKSLAAAEVSTKTKASQNSVTSVNRRTIHKTKKASRHGKQSRHTGFSLFGLPIPPLISWLPGIVMVAIAAGLLNYSFGRYVNTQEVFIPDLVNLNIDVARKEVQSIGLNSQVQAVVSDEEVGTVVKMQPKARTPLRQGRTIQLMYAVPTLESTQVLVPQLVARGIIGEEAAKLAVEEAGLKLAKVIEIHSSLAEGQIIAQSIAARQTVREGSSLDLIFSKGPRQPQTFMPDFRGMMLEEAQPYIDLLGLIQAIQVDEQVSTEKPVGTILKQYIKANTIIDPTKTTLRLLVATAGELEPLRETSIPNFIGILDLNNAYDLAAEYGFEITEVTQLSSPSLNHGVVSQTPLPYQALAEASNTITLMFNRNAQHLASLQSQNTASVGNPITPIPNATTIGVTNGVNTSGVNQGSNSGNGFAVNPVSGTGVGTVGFNPTPTAGTGVSNGLAPSLPQTTGFPQSGTPQSGTPQPNNTLGSSTSPVPTPTFPTTTDINGMTPVTTISVETSDTPIPNPGTTPQTSTQSSAQQEPVLQGSEQTTVQSTNQAQNEGNGNFSYRWTIAPLTQTQLVAVYVTLADGSIINIDNSWLEVGETEVQGIYSYPGYSGQLVFELRDYDTNTVIGQPITIQ